MKTFDLDPKSPKTWLIGAVALTAGVALAALFFTLFLAAAAVGAVALPILLWRKKRALERRPPPRAPSSSPNPRVIDAEYEVHE